MNKDAAKKILGVKNQGLADHLKISEGAVRNMKDLSHAQAELVMLYWDKKQLTAENNMLNDKIQRVTRALDN